MNEQDLLRLLEHKDEQLNNLSNRLITEREAAQKTISMLNKTITEMATIDYPWNQPLYLQTAEFLHEIIDLNRVLLNATGKYQVHDKAKSMTHPAVKELLMKIAECLDWFQWDD